MLDDVGGRQVELLWWTSNIVSNAGFQCFVADGAGFLYRDPIRPEKEIRRRLDGNRRGYRQLLRDGEVESSPAVCHTPIADVSDDEFGITHEFNSLATGTGWQNSHVIGPHRADDTSKSTVEDNTAAGLGRPMYALG